QASKAQRYQEYSNRLKELRIGLGLREYGELSAQLDERTGVLDGLRAELEERAGRAAAWEADTQRLDQQLAELDDCLHRQEAALGRIREQIKTDEATLLHEGNLSVELEAELGRTRKRLSELTAWVASLNEAYTKAREEYLAADEQARGQRRDVRSHEETLAATVAGLAGLQRQAETDNADQLEQMRQAAQRQKDAHAAKAQPGQPRREPQ